MKFPDLTLKGLESHLKDAADTARRLGRAATDVAESSIEDFSNRNVRVAVTGLSRSGKTVFTTSLVHNLLRAPERPSLMPFLKVVSEGRLRAARRERSRHLHLPQFPYEDAVSALTNLPPQWPPSTDRISEIRLALRYKPTGPLTRVVGNDATLYVDIVDYPGEWLLDLPMLQQSYAEWSQQTLLLCEQLPRKQLAAQWLSAVQSLDPAQPSNETLVGRLATLYRNFLIACHAEPHGLVFLQPGRFLRPAGDVPPTAPAMQFCPLPHPAGEAPVHGSVYAVMEERYEAYRTAVIRPFYTNHFARFDRQVVLVDVLKALGGGPMVFQDMRLALTEIVKSFSYGQGNFVTRIFKPKIDRVLFAATKADHVSSTQHRNLKRLLRELLMEPANEMKFAHVDLQTLAIASIRATEDVVGHHQGQPLSMVRGKPRGRDEKVAVFPGEVPDHFPLARDWIERHFKYYEFVPDELEAARVDGFPHINLDGAIEFLIGDKLR